MSTSPQPTRYSSLSLQELVSLCAGSRDDDVWQEFISRVGRPISLTILRTASMWTKPSPALVEDLVQMTYIKLFEDGCRLLRDFAIEHPEAILGYLKRIAANLTHDYFKHHCSQTSGGDRIHVSTVDVDPEISGDVHGSQERVTFSVFLREVKQHLQHCLAEPYRQRDEMIFWLYFGQGMSTKEIAAISVVSLGTKGVGSVIERLKRCVRTQILGSVAA